MALQKNDAEHSIVAGDFTTAAVRVTINTSHSQATASLATGFYEITSDVDFYFTQGASGIAVSSSNGHWCQAGVVRWLTVSRSAEAFIAAATPAGSGTLFLSKKGVVLP